MDTTILITGAGGAAAVSIMKALDGHPYRIVAADMDPHAAGLYLSDQRVLLPAAGDPAFAARLLSACIRHRVNILIPTVDAELIAVARGRHAFEAHGVRVMTGSPAILGTVLDKALLASALAGVIPVPETHILDHSFNWSAWKGGAVVKPREGAGSRGIRIFDRLPATPPSDLPMDGSMLVQALLPGAEYSVDVLADASGRPVAAVPRERMKVDSGVAVTARTVRDPELESVAMDAVSALHLPFVSNVQLKRDADGRPALLEINPRFPGTMPLTVASGVNMPLLAVQAIMGASLPDGPIPFRETAVVRFWSEQFLSPDQLVDAAVSPLAA